MTKKNNKSPAGVGCKHPTNKNFPNNHNLWPQ